MKPLRDFLLALLAFAAVLLLIFGVVAFVDIKQCSPGWC
jgi:hypothetical protein